MKKIIIGTMALTAGLLLTGCGESAPKEESAPKVESAPKEKRAPECGSNDVKNMIIDGFSTKSTEVTKGYLESNKKKLAMYGTDRKFAESIKKTIAEQEATIKEGGSKFNLKKILTDSVDDRAQKSVCRAELHTIEGGKHFTWDVGYTAQYSSDGELIIEMERFKKFYPNYFNPKSVTDVIPEKRASHNVESDGNNRIKQKKTVNNKETKSNNSVSNTPQCTIGVVHGLDPYGDGFLSLRVKPKSTEIGKLYNGDELEILDKSGKYYKVKDLKSSKIGWAHSNWIKPLAANKDELVASVPPGDKGQPVNNSASDTSQCTYFKVERVRQLNIRDKAGTPSNIVGSANNGESICVYDFTGKWGRTDRGWISVKYLSKDYKKSNFLLADIDNDGKNERFQWKYLEDGTEEIILQPKLLDDDGSLLWEGPDKDQNDEMYLTSVDEYPKPAILDDIDGDGKIELVISYSPHEAYSPGFLTYIWDGKKFIKATKSKFIRDLVWIDAPYGKTLKWTRIDDKEYSKKKKIWWTHGLQTMNNNDELPMVNIEGIQYTGDSFTFCKGILSAKAKIRFTPSGAVIKELIK